MTCHRSQSKLPVKPGVEPRFLTLKLVFSFSLDLLTPKPNKNTVMTGALSDPAFCFPDRGILHWENDHTCLSSLFVQETLF